MDTSLLNNPGKIVFIGTNVFELIEESRKTLNFKVFRQSRYALKKIVVDISYIVYI